MRKQDSARRARAGTKVGVWSLCASLAIGLAACGSSNKSQCHYMALADGLLGQTTYAGVAANQGIAVSGATLAGPIGGLTEDGAGTVAYVADTANNRILGYSTPPTTIGAAADFVLGQADLSTSASSGIGGLLNPAKVWVSDDNRLVVSDTGHNRVLIWNTLPKQTGVPPDVVIGQPGTSTVQANQGGISASTLSSPTAAALESNKLIVVDQGNNRVLIYDATVGTLASGEAATTELGQIDDGSGSTGFKSNATGFFVSPSSTQPLTGIQFNSPSDLWTDGALLVVSDPGNNRVLAWRSVPTVNFATADVVLGQPSGFITTNPGISNQLLNNPQGVVVSANNLYIADTGNNRVVEYDSGWSANQRSNVMNSVFGQQDFTHDAYNDDDQNNMAGSQTNDQSNTNATQNTMHNPSGIFADNQGHLWVADRANNRIISFALTQRIDGTDTDGRGGVDDCNGYNPILPNTR